jgi:hypothetical protein
MRVLPYIKHGQNFILFYNFLPVMPKIYLLGVTQKKKRKEKKKKRKEVRHFKKLHADRTGHVNVKNALPFAKGRFQWMTNSSDSLKKTHSHPWRDL